MYVVHSTFLLTNFGFREANSDYDISFNQTQVVRIVTSECSITVIHKWVIVFEHTWLQTVQVGNFNYKMLKKLPESQKIFIVFYSAHLGSAVVEGCNKQICDQTGEHHPSWKGREDEEAGSACGLK